MRMGSAFRWVFALAVPLHAQACWDDAARRYGLTAELLYAIARVESGLDPRTVNRSHVQRTGSYDLGLMQINSTHLAMLATRGITPARLLDACTNIDVGAWLLADLFRRHGATWDAVGAYNASCRQLDGASCAAARSAFAWKVYRQLRPRQAQSAERALNRLAPSSAAASAAFAFSSRVSP